MSGGFDRTTQFIPSAKAINFDISDIPKYIEFISKFNSWVHSSKQPLSGLPEKYTITNGITDAFNQTYGLYNRVGIFDGEYGYHQLVLKDRVTTNLTESDCIIISHPFSGDGMCSHARIREADKLNIPIIIDCAFFGICHDIDFRFNEYKNIHSVCFSLSKTFGTGFNRVGLLYTNDNYPATLYGQWKYPSVSSAIHHYDIIDTMGPDVTAQKYKQQQISICDVHGLVPSNTIIFGLDYENKYPGFNRGPVGRVCITNLIDATW